MKRTLIILFALLVLPSFKYAYGDGCSQFYLYDLSLQNLGIVSVTDGTTGVDINATTPATYQTTVCFTPGSIIIAGQTAQSGVSTVMTLQSGKKISVNWVSNGVEVTDYGEQAIKIAGR